MCLFVGVLLNLLKPYEERAAEDKKRYEREMAEYPESDPEEPVKKRKKKDPNAPRKNLNAWMFFVQQVRPQVVAELGDEGKRVATVTKAVSERWSKMSPEEKAVRPNHRTVNFFSFATSRFSFTSLPRHSTKPPLLL